MQYLETEILDQLDFQIIASFRLFLKIRLIRMFQFLINFKIYCNSSTNLKITILLTFSILTALWTIVGPFHLTCTLNRPTRADFLTFFQNSPFRTNFLLLKIQPKSSFWFERNWIVRVLSIKITLLNSVVQLIMKCQISFQICC